ncbi:hypothetical protein O6H91_21G044200 [Diphasiastrum complanatum]|uniref:Uncharacterized protein n=1 Tax=Diphasiastrum complanatum TaxID=34168 RepID=A0ACC2AJY1_DIPCM|nr:hypothetical protein O6H91_21G044200 [Diphasiastrum complanatum]
MPINSTHPSVNLFHTRITRSQPRSSGKAKTTQLEECAIADEESDVNQRLQEELETPIISARRTVLFTSGNCLFSGNENDLRDAASMPTRIRYSPTVAPKLSSVAEGMGATPKTVACTGSLREVKVAGLIGRQLNERLEALSDDGTQSSRIMVYVRLRPISKKEKEAGSRSCIRIVNKRDVYLTEFALETDYLRLKRLRGRHFAFDAAFPENTSQQEVYDTSTAELIEGVMQGRNCSVFCYGATGAGKTHTMLGTMQSPGVMVLALKDLFAKLNQHSSGGDYIVKLSYLEVYNESVRDLLSPGRPLILREDSKQGIVAAGLSQYQAYSADEVMLLLQRGNQNRQTEPTRINETSSRSHAILQVVAEYKVQQEAGCISRVGKLSLIDLAGSERALATDQRTLRSLEGANINRSLLALSSCINALVEGKKHIPFRNSKLTQLLKDSLGGACQTAMIANISPSNICFGETQNTLHWADRAKEIRTKALSNEDLQIPESQEDQTKLLLQMQQENQQLRFQLASLQQKYLAVQSASVSSTPVRIGSHLNELPCSPAPFLSPTPSARLTAIHASNSKRPQSGTQGASANGDKAADRAIKELKRTIQIMERETERVQKESARREENLNASIATLHREHSVQLKNKDEFIRKLCERISAGDQTMHKNKSYKSPDKHHNIRDEVENIRNENISSKVVATRKVAKTSERLKRLASPKFPRNACLLPSSNRALVPATDQGTKTGRLRRASTLTTQPQITPLPRFNFPAKIEVATMAKKRTFWDISNTNSPEVLGRVRPTRSNLSTPSMLLQPGFARRLSSQT